MSVDLEKIKTRYRRLLAMSGDVNSPHEAAIAARRAASLMRKYDFDEADCADGSPEDAWTVDDFVATFAELRQKRVPQIPQKAILIRTSPASGVLGWSSLMVKLLFPE